MTVILIRNTATDLVMGPFVDDTDYTAETGLAGSLTVYRIDSASYAARNSTGTITHLGGGFYKVPLSATDTNNADAGAARRNVTFYARPSGVLPIWVNCLLVEEAYTDPMFGTGPALVTVTDVNPVSLAETPVTWNLALVFGGAHDFTAETIPADIAAINGATAPAGNLEDLLDGTGLDLSASNIAANVTAIDGLTTAAQKLARSAAPVIYGEAIAGTLTAGQFTTDLSGYATDQLAGRWLFVTSGNREGETQKINGNTAGGTITLAANLTGAPAAGDEFTIL